MSIATLKKKTEARYFPHSVPNVGFSLNGVTRFLGAGDTSLGRSVTRTPFRGSVPMGHGGGGRCRVSGVKGRASRCDSNDEYPINIIRSGEQVPQTLVKKSTMSYVPYWDLRYMNTLEKAGCHWVKDRNSELNRICLVKDKDMHPKPCTPGVPIRFTKTVPGSLHYDFFYKKKVWDTRVCAVPSLPPRLNNTSCAQSV